MNGISFRYYVKESITIISPDVNTHHGLIPLKSNLIKETFYYKPESIFSSKTIADIARKCLTKYILFANINGIIDFIQFGLERFYAIAETTRAGILYSDYYLSDIPHPAIDYQEGSVRDDFDFGPAILINAEYLKEIITQLILNHNYAGFYSARLAISRKYKVLRIPELLYRIFAKENGSSHFDYVNPKNREAQLEMEEAFTDHLKKTNAFLDVRYQKTIKRDEIFPVEATVIIPVKNRVNTIKDAVQSALLQETNFPFNVIVVDNYSTDGTTELLNQMADKKLIHVIPERTDLGIGGCWNEAIININCGKYSIQLDSDDIYSDKNTLQSIVDKFNEDDYAMVIGSYKLTDINLNEIPPGIIDHKEWTDTNGHNNALRINGLGAPRAFYTPVIRNIKFPNVNYGEDYSAALAVCRSYKTGRIYEPIYLCRRWEGNSDSQLSLEKKNAYNYYKDTIRTFELYTRRALNESRN